MPVTTFVGVDSSLPATIQSRKGNCGKCISPQLRRKGCIAVAERTIHPSPAFFTRPKVVFRLRERQKIPTRWTGGDGMQLHMRNVYTGSGKKVSLYITLISVTSTDRPPSSRLHPTSMNWMWPWHSQQLSRVRDIATHNPRTRRYTTLAPLGLTNGRRFS